MSLNLIGRIHPMITESTSPFLYIDSGNDEPDMTLQRREDREWVDYKVDGKVVKSPVDIDALPAGRYRLV
jgi:hypothetical protein